MPCRSHDYVHFLCLLTLKVFATRASALSRRSSLQTQSLRDIPRRHAARRPILDHLSAPVQCAKPFPWYHPRPSLAPRVANSRFLRRRHCELTPTKRRLPYSPARSTTSSLQSHPSDPASLPSRDKAKQPSHNPNDRAQSQSALSVRRWPPNHLPRGQTCPAHHSPASKCVMAALETSRVFA